MSVNVYGMSGCTTVKRAQDWLAENQVAHSYAHYNKLDDLAGTLDMLIAASSLTQVLNTNSQAFKKLDENTQHALLNDRAAAVRAMAENPRLAKRPLAFDGARVLSGFKAEEWQSLA